jgi:hypothetical protein
MTLIGNPFPRANRSMEDYLINGREVLLFWAGNGRFNCSSEIRKPLEFPN